MIVCSCNVLSDQALRSAAANAAGRPRVSQMYACLGCKAQCGRCAGTVRRIMEEALTSSVGHGVIPNPHHC